VVEVQRLEEREAAIEEALGRKVLLVVSRRMLKLQVRMARVLQNRRGWVVELLDVVVASHRPQVWVVIRVLVRNGC
jgi:hypothetical protein